MSQAIVKSQITCLEINDTCLGNSIIMLWCRCLHSDFAEAEHNPDKNYLNNNNNNFSLCQHTDANKSNQDEEKLILFKCKKKKKKSELNKFQILSFVLSKVCQIVCL